MVHVHPGKVTVASPLAAVLAWRVISGSTRSCRPVVAGKDLKLEQEHKGAWPIAVLQMSSLSLSVCMQNNYSPFLSSRYGPDQQQQLNFVVFFFVTWRFCR